MGVDAVIWLKPNRELEPGELDALDQCIRKRFGGFVSFYDEVPMIERSDPYYPGYLEMSLAERYWGPGYERGSFIGISALLEYLVRVFPGDVFYAHDSGFDGPPDTRWQDQREDLWRHFISDDFDGYHENRAGK